VDVERINEPAPSTPEVQALMRQGIQLFDSYVKLNRRVSFEVAVSLNHIEDPSRFADTIASNILIKISEKQLLLEIADPATGWNGSWNCSTRKLKS